MVSLDALMRLPGVLAVSEPAAPAVDEDALGRCMETALGGVVAMREAEGGRLESALRRSLREIGEAVAAIEAAAPARLLRETRSPAGQGGDSRREAGGGRGAARP